jgi:hypothetical protein
MISMALFSIFSEAVAEDIMIYQNVLYLISRLTEIKFFTGQLKVVLITPRFSKTVLFFLFHSLNSSHRALQLFTNLFYTDQ